MPEERSERYRTARPHEVDDVAALVAHSFPSPDRGVRWWRDYLVHGPHGGPETIWLAESGDALAGCCLLLPLTQWISGRPFPMAGVGVVTTSPTHRRRGVAGRMLRAGLRAARDEGSIVSALYPFRTAYYRGLGYGLAGEAHQYIVPAAAFPDAPADRRRVRLVRSTDDRARLADVYARGIRLQTGQVERSAHAWRYVLEGDERAAVLYVADDGEAEGYAIVRYRADLPVERRFLDVEERMWLSPGARAGILAWLGSMGDQWARVAYRAHPNERFDAVIDEPRLPHGAAEGWQLWYPAATLLRGPMFRLLDVERALSVRSYSETAPIDVILAVDDPVIPENEGPWRVRIEGGRAAVERVESAPSVRLDMHALSSAFIGESRLGDGVRAGHGTAADPDALRRLETAFDVPRPWTFERF